MDQPIGVRPGRFGDAAVATCVSKPTADRAMILEYGGALPTEFGKRRRDRPTLDQGLLQLGASSDQLERNDVESRGSGHRPPVGIRRGRLLAGRFTHVMTLSRRHVLKCTLSVTALAGLSTATAMTAPPNASADKLRVTMANVKDFGATGDGTTDDTAAIHAARDAAGAGGRVIIPSGTYIVSGLAASVADQTWESSAAAVIKLKVGVDTRAAAEKEARVSEILWISADGVTVTGGVFDCSNGTTSNEDWSMQGIRVTGDRVTIRESKVLNSPRHGIYALNCSRVTVRSCTITNSFGAGIFVQHDDESRKAVDDIVITDNAVEGSSNTAGGIVVRGNSAKRPVNRVTISRNTVDLPSDQGDGVTAAFSVWHGVDWVMNDNRSNGGYFGHTHPSPTRASISNNVVRGFKHYGMEVPGNVNHCVMSGNVIDPEGTNANIGITVGAGGSSQDVTIIGNSITGFLGGYLISFVSNDGVGAISGATVVGNKITSEMASRGFTGLYASSTVTDLVFSGNVVDAASTADSYGIQFLQKGPTTGVLIIGNQFTNLAVRAVDLSKANGGTFDNLRFTGNLVRNCPEELGGSGLVGAANLVTDSVNAPAANATPGP